MAIVIWALGVPSFLFFVLLSMFCSKSRLELLHFTSCLSVKLQQSSHHSATCRVALAINILSAECCKVLGLLPVSESHASEEAKKVESVAKLAG